MTRWMWIGMGVMTVVCGLALPRSWASPPRQTAPQTALVALELQPEGRARVLAVTPKRTPWAGPHATSPLLRPSARPTAAARPARFRVLHVIVEAQGEAPRVVELSFAEPVPGGDVVDVWDTGGTLVRLPWLGPGTTLFAVALDEAGAPLGVAFTWREGR